MIRSGVIRPASEVVGAGASATPDATALLDDLGPVSYRELDQRTAALATDLEGLGVKPGDRVGVYMSNSAAWVEGSLATVRAGAVSVGVPAPVGAEDAAFMLADSGAKVVLTDAAHRAAAQEATAGDSALADLRVVVADKEGGKGGRHSFGGVRPVEETAGSEPRDQDLDAPAWILYTSGTTGRPKGVVLTQRSMMWVVAAGWIPSFEWGPGDLVLCPLPLTHSYPLDATLAALAVGATTFLLPGFSPTATMEILNAHEVTVLLGVPTVFSFLLGEYEPEAYTRRALRMCVCAGAVLSADVAGRGEALLGAPILDAYGATEASTAITMCSVKGESPPGSCGVSLPGMAVRVVDPVDSRDRAPGEEGEVIARGPGVMSGYYDRPEETAAALREGWYRTGDLGRFDRHGNLFITGRLKDIIIRGGENIAPAEIENVVSAYPGVDDCAVIGVEHESLGEVPVVAIVGSARDSEDDLAEAVEAYCRERLPRSKRPDRVVALEAIPRTGSGKVMRHRVREAVEVTAG